MADADHPILYYRTNPRGGGNAGPDYPGNPRTSTLGDRGSAADLNALDPALKIVCDGQSHFPRNGGGATMFPPTHQYTPNIVLKPIPLSGAVVVKVQEAGKRDEQFAELLLNVSFKRGMGLAWRVWGLQHLRQTNAHYPLGRFGLWYPAFHPYSCDPRAEGGLVLAGRGTEVHYRDRSVDFKYAVIVGGEPLRRQP